jgi:lysophospholipase L1-like esterase
MIVRRIARTLLGRLGDSRRSQFESLPAPRGAVVFLGDSITHQGLWESWFPELPTANRGISGEVVDQVAARLDSSIDHPAAVSILIGTNDIGGNGGAIDVDTIGARFDALVTRIRELAPDAFLLVNSVMPRQPEYADQIHRLNDIYRLVADRTAAAYLDLWPALATPERSLRPEFTLDGLHLNGAGYRVWTDSLRPHLAAFGRDKAPGARCPV